MEIIFLLAGLALIAAGAAIIVSDLQAKRGTRSVQARIVGFSNGRVTRLRGLSFHSVAKYVGPDGRTYYVEGAVGSSAPLHAVGDSVVVLVNAKNPEQAQLKSALSIVMGTGLALMGMAAVMLFRFTFHASIYSFVTAGVVLGAFAFKIRKVWRKPPLTFEAWKEYKKQIFVPRVFTEQSRDQILWADPTSVSAATKTHEKSRRVAVPLLLLIGFGLLFVGHYFYGKTEAFLERANRAEGLVIDLRESESSDDSTTYAAVVEYKDQRGDRHEFVDAFSSSPPFYHTGQMVRVLYDRDNPREAQVDRGPGNYLITFLSGSLGALLVLLGVSSLRRRSRRI